MGNVPAPLGIMDKSKGVETSSSTYVQIQLITLNLPYSTDKLHSSCLISNESFDEIVDINFSLRKLGLR